MILGAKKVPKLVKNTIENMIDFWSAPGRDLNGLWGGSPCSEFQRGDGRRLWGGVKGGVL